MTTHRRILDEPAWLLHHRPFRDSSRILDILSRDHGRLSVVARGSRSAKSRLRGILRPFLPLRLSWVIRSDLGTLTGAEIDGSLMSLSGDALLSAYYVNELLLNFLHKHDPQPEIFAVYADTIANLGSAKNLQSELRSFEIELLRMLGYALNLDHDTHTHEILADEGLYAYRPEHGPVSVADRQGPMIFAGRQLLAVSKQQFDQPEVLRDAGRLLRETIDYHLGGKELKTRKVLMELRRPANP